MASLYDRDGIDGPFERRMASAVRPAEIKRRYILAVYTRAGKVESLRVLDTDQRIALEIALQERGQSYVLTPDATIRHRHARGACGFAQCGACEVR